MFKHGCLVALLLAAPIFAAGTATSGPQVGTKVPGPFSPLNVTGPDAGKNSCLYCRNGAHPVVMIFARQLSPQLENLLRRVNDATGAHADDSMGSCAIFCNEAAALPGQLATFAKQSNMNHTILATCAVSGPPRYKISSEAEVTVLLYNHGTVRANHSFKSGELDQPAVDKIMADLPLIISGD
jgi:hypothetical protein